MRVVAWNIHGALRYGINDAATAVLWHRLQADVGLVQEAFIEPEAGHVVGQPFTADRSSSSSWGTYVWSRPQGPLLDAPGRTPVGAASADEIEDSDPGTTAVARVDLAGTTVHLVSVYGALTGHPTRNAVDTMHRVISDLSDLMRGNVAMLIAGDLNITTQPYASGDPGQWWHAQDATVFDRFKTLGMVDLIERFLPKSHQGSPGCPCQVTEPRPTCRHVRTTRHMKRPDSTPYQNDWAFATPALLPLVKDCAVRHEEAVWEVSDHAPIVIDLEAA